jgi:hypothetical protein
VEIKRKVDASRPCRILSICRAEAAEYAERLEAASVPLAPDDTPVSTYSASA